eukprot:scaffold34659_cov180-Amphora_coffeaeformis.AAC.2
MCEATVNAATSKSTTNMSLSPPTGSRLSSSMPSTTSSAPPPTKEVHVSESHKPPPQPSLAARYTCAGIMVAIFAVWGQCTFGVVQDEVRVPVGDEIHSWKVPTGLCLSYLISLPVLKAICQRYLWNSVDVRALLTEAMVVYNAGQVLLNGWMVYRTIHAVAYGGHPFIGGTADIVSTGATYAVWVHYCDKYLEFMDTYFMVLRGKMDQVSFLHVYHHVSISLAWWFALKASPGGDSYFGALVNSWIHVMMYSYYTLALLKIPCPWKRYLTQAQLVQFVSVVGYTIVCYTLQPAGTWFMPYFVQLFEMVSLLVLFLHFYRKAYRSKQASKKSQAAAEAAAAPSVPIKVVDGEEDNGCDEPDTVSSTSSEGVSSDDGDE